ncbi:hypothetical protein [Arthrobacter sp. Leaf69]|uniref:hypothetical protein n=1 Tax=Arthrobacter sp. Leaf69 TaxID=1736232 RepID=UPI0006F4E931|nr:hypothetical protein [Arthrobacter sp. Leaf69]KQN88980.1 hypothetical protein ASE96_04960 [Arthrobacter sp. Leaf69]
MNDDKSEVQEVLVDIPKYDKDGNPVTLDSLSSGGARNAAGFLQVQYRNPRIPEAANEPEFDRDFEESLRREYDARRRREEIAEERARKEYARLQFVYDNVVRPYVIPRVAELWDTQVLPAGKRLWDTKMLPGGKRLAQRWLRPKRSQSEAPGGSEDSSEFGAENANPLATSTYNTDHTAEISTVQEGGDDAPLADVIQIDEFQNRRSA